MKGPKPPADYRIPLGKAKIVRAGTDITIVTSPGWCRGAGRRRGAGPARDQRRGDRPAHGGAARQGDHPGLAGQTNRLLIAHEAVTDFGIGAEIAALAVYQGFWTLDAPVPGGAAPTPSPLRADLEKPWLPDRQAIERAAEALVKV